MSNAECMKRTWLDFGEEVASFPFEAMENSDIDEFTKRYLSVSGLPCEAAPFLTFEVPKNGKLVGVNEMWNISRELEPHLVIGFNGSGDPVVVNKEGVVLYLNHDNDFRSCYINKNVEVLWGSLIEFRKLIDEAQQANGPDAYLDGTIPNESLERFKNFLNLNDPKALLEGSMWADELQFSA